MTGKRYDSDAEGGRRLWNKVIGTLAEEAERLPQGHVLDPAQPRYGAEYLARCRLGQGGFKIAVGSAYRWRCAVCGEKTKPVLEAAHIKPFSASGRSRTENGLLLRADLHKLFDKGYLTVTIEYQIEVSHRLEEEFENGKDYNPFHGWPRAAEQGVSRVAQLERLSRLGQSLRGGRGGGLSAQDLPPPPRQDLTPLKTSPAH